MLARALSVAGRARRAAAADVCCALGAVLAHHRQAAGWSQEQLAAVCDVSQGLVSGWEDGTQTIGATHLLLVAARLGVPAAALVAEGWADASPCARMLVPAPAGDEPVLLRWRRPPRRLRPPTEAPGPSAAGWLVPELEVCEVGWRRGHCPARPTLVAVKANRTGRWDRPSDPGVRWVVRPVCRVHADRLVRGGGGWTISPLDG